MSTATRYKLATKKAPPQRGGDNRSGRGSPARRLNSGTRLYKFFKRRLGLSRQAAGIATRSVSFAYNPSQWVVRRALANRLNDGHTPSVRIAPEAGYGLFAPADLPGVDLVVRDCIAAYREVQANLETDYSLRSAKKQFQIYILSDAEFAAYPRIMGFALSQQVIRTIARYTGQVPLLCRALLYLTLENNSISQSQQFHLDLYSPRPIKLFINIFDTSPDQGPFTFLPADVSADICRQARYDGDGRLADEAVEAGAGRGRAIQLVGPAGTGCFVDAARCLHYGGRQNRKPRLVLMLKYVRFCAPEERPAAWDEVAASMPAPLDRTQRLVLGQR